jgi:hypothetical protein
MKTGINDGKNIGGKNMSCIFLPRIFLPFSPHAALALLVGLLANTMPAAGEGTPAAIRVASVGDNTTQGGHGHGEETSPAVLGRLLVADNTRLPADGSTDFLLFAAEGMHKVVILARNGSIQWEYPAEMSRDAWRLPTGNVLFCYNNEYNAERNDNPSGVMEVTPDKRVVFHFRTLGQVWSCQRMTDGDTLVGAASQGRLLLVGPDGTLVRSIKLRGAPGHSCLRNARQIEGGHFLVAEEGSHAVREYSADGALLREIKVDFPPYSAVRLTNGHTLACGQGKMAEFDGQGEAVWSVRSDDFPELGIRWFAGLQVLPDGNILVCNAGGKVPFFELNHKKEIVWRWPATAPLLSLGHGLQRLDIPTSPLK